MEPTKADQTLFRQRLGDWQERYMEKLCAQYIELLSDAAKPASERFWALEKRIRADKRRPGVLLELRKGTLVYDLAALIRDRVISPEELSDFSPELREAVSALL